MLSEEIGKYVRIGLDMMGVVFLIIVLYGGLVWMTAGGKPENVDSARKIIIQGALGLAVTLMAYQLTSFIIKQIVSKL
jgi:TRAP-type C4-dicarboxylate transport system permease small subunit